MIDGVGRLASFVAAALLFGLPLILLIVLRPSRSIPGASSARIGSALEALAEAALVLGVVGTSAILFQEASVVADFRGEELSVSALTAVFDTSFGRWYGVKLPLLVALSVLLIGRVKLSLSESPGTGWWLAWIVLAGALLVTTSFAGHAAAKSSLVVANDAVHLLSTSVWFTGVVGLTLLAVFVTPTSEDLGLLPSAVVRFSRVALVSVGLIAVTGALNSVFQVKHPGDLLDSNYGRVLSVKLGLFAIVLGLGAINHWRVAARFRSTRDSAATTRLLRRTIATELVVAIAIMAATAVLVASSPTRKTANAGSTTEFL